MAENKEFAISMLKYISENSHNFTTVIVVISDDNISIMNPFI